MKRAGASAAPVGRKHTSRVEDIQREAALPITGKANVTGCVVIRSIMNKRG